MNFFRTRTLWAVFVAVSFLAPLLHADSLRFKNGTTVEAAGRGSASVLPVRWPVTLLSLSAMSRYRLWMCRYRHR